MSTESGLHTRRGARGGSKGDLKAFEKKGKSRRRLFIVVCFFAAVSMGQMHGQEPGHLRAPLGLDEQLPEPEDNPLTPEKVELGRRLFFDKRLSADNTVACSSCHRPELAFSDGQAVSTGIGGRRGKRNSPAVINRAYGDSQFWDGRASTLEEQALSPIEDPSEMGLGLADLIERLESDESYVSEFWRAFPQQGVTASNVARALASFVRTLRSGDSPFDRFQNGDADALRPEELRGLKLFRGKGNCVACHVGHNLTDEKFHNTGVSWGGSDVGRFKVTGKEGDRGAFKTPTLREVARTAPYMHDGSLETLEHVIEFYNRGGVRNPNVEIRPLHLNADERGALLAFLRALSGSGK